MNKIKKYITFGCVALSLSLGSCVNDLNMKPNDPNTSTEFTNGAQYNSFFAQLYGGLAVSGVDGGSDISVDDGGAGTYTRQLFNLQELCTDEALIGTNWNDAGLPELVYSMWSTDNHWLYEAMSRFTFQINMCNEFIRTIDGAAGVENPISASAIAEMKVEARVLRALSYYHLIDIFGRGPLTTESDLPGVTPKTATREELYNFVVNDLKDAVDQLPLAANQVYGRVSREAGYMLLAKFYLNAGVYTGTPAWNDCATYCNKILETIPNLAPDYKYLFCASNDKYVRGGGEILWAIPFDADSIQSYGGTTYLTVGAYNANVPTAEFGISQDGWGGIRMRPELVNSLDADFGDARALYYAGTFKKDFPDKTSFGDWSLTGSGYMSIKFRNTNEANYYNDPSALPYTASSFSSIDFPVFRLADTFLMLAECQLNGATNAANGKNCMDKVRARAGLTPIALTADNLLAERHRELFFECHRRSDLIRFGKFTGGNYVWQWKGGIASGAAIDSKYNVYAISSKFTSTLGQNSGY